MIDDGTEPAPLLEARALVFARNDEPVFGPLDFRLHAGDVVMVEGANGSGKTTLLKVISGLLEATSGELRLHGERLTRDRLAQVVMLLGHRSGLKGDLSVRENLRFACGLAGLRSGMSPARALIGVGLEAYEDVPVRQLSAGQTKRVALARALLSPAALWLLDEPFANLDLEGIDLVNRLLERHARLGGAALVTSHGAYAYTGGTARRIALQAAAD
jgi:heme exporter protein A